MMRLFATIVLALSGVGTALAAGGLPIQNANSRLPPSS